MSFLYKRDRTTVLVDEFARMDPRLQLIAHAMCSFCWHFFEKDLVITEIFRMEQQQRSYYPNEPYKKSVHQFGRGIDFGVRAYIKQVLDPDPATGVRRSHPGFTDKEIQLIDVWFSRVVQYDDERPEFDSLVHHNVGLGDHLHFQVSWRTTTRLITDVPTVQRLMQRLGLRRR